jgi:Ni/Co efflux regulator RcnB
MIHQTSGATRRCRFTVPLIAKEICMKRFLAIATALCLALPSVALAAPGDRHKPGGGKPPTTKPAFGAKPVGRPPGNGNNPNGSHNPRPPGNGNRPRPPGQGHHKPPPNWHKPKPNQFFWRGKWFGRYRAPAYVYPRGYSYQYWRIGDVLPLLFLSTQYYFDNYAQIGLEVPPPGYRWVRYGPDALLVNARTGAVEDVVYGAFY